MALSQVRSRMQFWDTGKAFSPYGTKFLIFFTLAVLSVNVWTFIALVYLVETPELWLILTCTIPMGTLDLFLIWTFIRMAIKTRKAIRERFGIQEQNCSEYEDTLIGVFCSCCSISQMGRHTADFDTYREQFLSPTGLPRNLEYLVPKQSYEGSINEESVEMC